MKSPLNAPRSNDLLYGVQAEALGGFDVVREASGFRNRQSIRTHSVNVKFNRFTHALTQFFDGFARRDTARQIRQIRRIVSFARFDNHCVPHNVKLYFSKPACVKILFKVFG